MMKVCGVERSVLKAECGFDRSGVANRSRGETVCGAVPCGESLPDEEVMAKGAVTEAGVSRKLKSLGPASAESCVLEKSKKWALAGSDLWRVSAGKRGVADESQ